MMKNQKETLKNQSPFNTAIKRIKYLGINPPKETKDLYTGNYKTLTKEIKDDINRWRDSMYPGRKNQYCENDYTNIVKMMKCNLQIQCVSYQITNGIFHGTKTENFTIHMETQKTPNSQSSLEKEEWSWRNQPS